MCSISLFTLKRDSSIIRGNLHWHFLHVNDKIYFLFQVKKIHGIHILMLQSNGIWSKILFNHEILLYRIINTMIILHAVRKHTHAQFSLATTTAPTLQNFNRRRSFPEVMGDRCSQQEHIFQENRCINWFCNR